jgi:hypothetical protein
MVNAISLVGRGERGPFRLPQSHIKDIGRVARAEDETSAGLLSAILDATPADGADYDEHALNALERFVEERLGIDLGEDGLVVAVTAFRAAALRCRRALRRLRERGDHRSVDVLYVAHGPADPFVFQLPELADAKFPTELRSLARYTDAVELVRVDLVHHKARKAASGEPNAAIDLSRHRALLLWNDRNTSSADALRHALTPFREPIAQEPDEHEPAYAARKEARKARQAAHNDRRGAFLTEVRREALVMLSEAERAYHDAWLASAG